MAHKFSKQGEIVPISVFNLSDYDLQELTKVDFSTTESNKDLKDPDLKNISPEAELLRAIVAKAIQDQKENKTSHTSVDFSGHPKLLKAVKEKIKGTSLDNKMKTHKKVMQKRFKLAMFGDPRDVQYKTAARLKDKCETLLVELDEIDDDYVLDGQDKSKELHSVMVIAQENLQDFIDKPGNLNSDKTRDPFIKTLTHINETTPPATGNSHTP